MLKRAQDPGDEAGRLNPICPHAPNPPSRGRVSGGDAGAETELNFGDGEIYSGTGSDGPVRWDSKSMDGR
jgi:hypothetical protein